jgi:glycerol kinase
MYARGVIVGLTRGANRNHIIRATLESIAYQSKDVIDLMVEESKIDLKKLKVDGGASKNNFLLQFQADILGVTVTRPNVVETTALGAAFLAGLAVGFWEDQSVLVLDDNIDRVYEPNMSKQEREEKYRGWKKAVTRALDWEG